MLKNAVNAPLITTYCMVALIFSSPDIAANNNDLTHRTEVVSFIQHMESTHQFTQQQLIELFRQTEIKKSIIEAISRPAEAKPWYQYRPIFVTDNRASDGAKFMQQHQAALDKAEQQYGVPAEIITAIIGVETRYGRYTGKFRVMDALATLAFEYPKRAPFFRSELEHYLLLTREEKIDPLLIKGSYAGAMGIPQFISSSYRHYAVDFDEDGLRDIWNNTNDAIGSVARYLALHHWQRNEPIATLVQVSGSDYKTLLAKGLKPNTMTTDMSQYGVFTDDTAKNRLAALLEYETKKGSEYWLGYPNFYSITRYNHSPLYGMAVFQLSQEILKLSR